MQDPAGGLPGQLVSFFDSHQDMSALLTVESMIGAAYAPGLEKSIPSDDRPADRNCS